MQAGESQDLTNLSNTITAGQTYLISVNIIVNTWDGMSTGMELHVGGCTFYFTASGSYDLTCLATVTGELYWSHDPTDTGISACINFEVCLQLP